MEGCVPDSNKYVPSLGAVQVRVPQPEAAVDPLGTVQVGGVVVVERTAVTSPAIDCTRGPCGGGVFAPSPGSELEAGHVSV